MSYLTAEQIVAAQKANMEVLFGLTEKAYAGVEKLVELNLQVAKAALSETSESVQAVMSVKDAQELMSLQQAMLQPAAEKAAAYSRQVYDILTNTNTSVGKVVEGQMADAQKKFLSAVDTSLKNAPAGSENAASLVKSAVTAANTAFESVQKAVKQATDVADANFQAMTQTAAKAAANAPKARRAA
jgi:phasin family protein